MVNQNQVTGFHVAETFAKRVYPEAVGELGIASSDVAGNTFAITQATKHAKCSSQSNLARSALVFHVAICWASNRGHFLWHQLHTVDHAGVVMGCGHISRLATPEIGSDLVT